MRHVMAQKSDEVRRTYHFYCNRIFFCCNKIKISRNRIFFCCERFFVSITINDYSFRLLNWNTIITMAPNARMASDAYAIPSVTCSE
jgi:hypothetical protein